MAAAVKQVNAHAETMGSQAALFMNINAAKGLLEVMKTNLGPRGTIKMLVGGAGGERERSRAEIARRASGARLERGGDLASPTLPSPCDEIQIAVSSVSTFRGSFASLGHARANLLAFSSFCRPQTSSSPRTETFCSGRCRSRTPLRS